MGTQDERVDAYIEKSADFAKPILVHLRKVVHAGCPDVEETLKWSMPHFTYKGMLCGMAAFKQHCTFGFWNAENLFEKSDPAWKKAEEAMGHFGCIKSLKDLPPQKELVGYVKKAAALNDAGIKRKAPARKKGPRKELVVPPNLAAALKKNRKAAATFEDFSYSHRKEYIEWLTEAKTEETRERRLAQAIEWMAEGKSRHWKYKNC